MSKITLKLTINQSMNNKIQTDLSKNGNTKTVIFPVQIVSDLEDTIK